MDGTVTTLLLDLALIVLLAQGLGGLAARLGQPAVIGEILAGILLGPTLLDGALSRTLFPTGVRPFLTAVADLGLVVFMFLVGMELDRRALRGAGRTVAGTALAATAIPFALGVLLSLLLARHYHSDHPLGFALFMGVATSVTAFPVLARIISDRGLADTLIGSVALSTAAVCDLASWTALALVQATVSDRGLNWYVLLAIPFGIAVFTVVRPLLARYLAVGRDRGTALSAAQFGVVLAGLLVSAAITQAIGLHFVFGAFLFGLVMPHDAGNVLTAELFRRLQLGTLLLLPVYFVVAGLQVDLATVGWGGLAVLAVVFVVAVTGKFGGTLVGARTVGLDWRQSAVMATLMNTRGLTELIVLSVGLQMGILPPQLYSLMVVMAVVTTAMSGPLLQLLTRGHRVAGLEPTSATAPEASLEVRQEADLEVGLERLANEAGHAKRVARESIPASSVRR